MQTVRCSLHPTENGVVYCTTCDANQVACLKCIVKNGKHFAHNFASLEDGMEAVTKQHSLLIDSLQLQRQNAIAIERKQRRLNKRLLNSVLQSVSDLHKAIDKLVDDLQQVRLALYTATLRAAQTARYKASSSVDMDKLAKTVLQSTLVINEMRKSLSCASTSTLSDLVDQTPKLLEKCTELQQAMQVGSVDYDNFTADTTVNGQFNDKLSQLSKQTDSLRQLSGKLFSPTPVAKELKNLLVVAGGFSGNITSFAYDTISSTWRPIASLSQARNGTYGTLWNGKVVIAGGHSGNNYLSSVEQYDPETNSWTALPNMLHSRQWLAFVCFKNTLYAIGGYNGVHLNSVEQYDSITEQWQLVASLNVARAGHCCAVSKNWILTAGGRNNSQVQITCELFDGTTLTWKYVASLLTARSCASAASLNDKVYIFGGHNGIQVVDSVEEYDSLADKWTLLPVRLSKPREGTAAATVNGRIYVCGGYVTSNIVDCFDMSEMGVSCVAPLPKALGCAAAVSVPVSDDLYRKLLNEQL